MKLDNSISTKSIKKIGTIAGVVSIVIVAYYATGLYKNYLQIKKLKETDCKNITTED